jgi:hypothetical protein
MAKYHIEFYELHAQTYEVEANSKEEAIENALGGEGTCLDNELHYIEVADRYNGEGLPDGIRKVVEV